MKQIMFGILITLLSGVPIMAKTTLNNNDIVTPDFLNALNNHNHRGENADGSNSPLVMHEEVASASHRLVGSKSALETAISEIATNPAQIVISKSIALTSADTITIPANVAVKIEGEGILNGDLSNIRFFGKLNGDHQLFDCTVPPKIYNADHINALWFGLDILTDNSDALNMAAQAAALTGKKLFIPHVGNPDLEVDLATNVPVAYNTKVRIPVKIENAVVGQWITITDSDSDVHVGQITAITDTTTDTSILFDAGLTYSSLNKIDGIPCGSTVTISGNIDVEQLSPIIFTGTSNTTSLVVGDQDDNSRHKIYHLAGAIRVIQSDWTSQACVGVKLQNLAECEVVVNQVTGFTVGIEAVGYTRGLINSNLKHGLISNNYIGIKLTADGITSDLATATINYADGKTTITTLTDHGFTTDDIGSNARTLGLLPNDSEDGLYEIDSVPSSTQIVLIGEITTGATRGALIKSFGWCNQNHIHGGRIFCGNIPLHSTSDRIGILITCEGPTASGIPYCYTNNGNNFFNQSIDLGDSYTTGDCLPIKILSGGYNYFNIRDEGNDSPTMHTLGESYNNQVELDYGEPTILDESSFAGNTVSKLTEPTQILPVFSISELQNKIIQYAGDNNYQYIPGLMRARSGDAYSYTEFRSTAIKYDDGVDFSNNDCPAIFVNTETAKTFIVSRDIVLGTGGYIVIQALDGADPSTANILDPATGNHIRGIKSGESKFASTTNFGGAFRSSFSNLKNTQFTVADNVKSIRLIIQRPSTGDFRLRGFSVYSVSNHTFAFTLPTNSNYIPNSFRVNQPPENEIYPEGTIAFNGAPGRGEAYAWMQSRYLSKSLSGGATTGDTVLSINSVSSVKGGMLAAVLLDSGDYFFSEITNLTTSTITLGDEITGDAASGNTIIINDWQPIAQSGTRSITPDITNPHHYGEIAINSAADKCYIALSQNGQYIYTGDFTVADATGNITLNIENSNLVADKKVTISGYADDAETTASRYNGEWEVVSKTNANVTLAPLDSQTYDAGETTIYTCTATGAGDWHQISNNVAANVTDADDSSLATLAASIDAIRDALVAAGLME